MLRVGDRVHIGGGYEMEPAWLRGGSGYTGTVEDFFSVANIHGKNEVAWVRLDEPLTFGNLTSSAVTLSLRYVGAKWADTETCHVTICARKPTEAKWWEDKESFVWAESHATYKRLGT